jgi:hypothetical protein
MKSTLASCLVRELSKRRQVVYDPFCGSGTVPLEAWMQGRAVIATDLSPYSAVLTKAKLAPPETAVDAVEMLASLSREAARRGRENTSRDVPVWVSGFFHPDTLREVLGLCAVLREEQADFFLACLLGILHHQRPGFLSYPSSHQAPYLRTLAFPREQYPELYAYRPVRERLVRKVQRAYRRFPKLDWRIPRHFALTDGSAHVPESRIDCIVTSPPYMRRLDYARDNRLRLWFLGVDDWRTLEPRVTPSVRPFVALMSNSLQHWRDILRPAGTCALVLGDAGTRQPTSPLVELIVGLATREPGGWSLVQTVVERSPTGPSPGRCHAGGLRETVVVLRRR